MGRVSGLICLETIIICAILLANASGTECHSSSLKCHMNSKINNCIKHKTNAKKQQKKTRQTYFVFKLCAC